MVIYSFEFRFNNSSDHRFSNTAIGFQNSSVSITYSDYYPGISLFSFSNPLFSGNFNIILVYRQQAMSHEHFLFSIQHVRDQFNGIIHLITGDVNIDAMTSLDNFLSRYLAEYKKMNNQPTHISGSLIDHVYVHKCLINKFNIVTYLRSIYFSDHDAVMMKLIKN